MKIKLTSVYVDDQEKALRFYTEVLGFVKKADFSNGPFRWLTVASPEDPDGTELQLALNNNPAAKAYQQAMFQQNQPAAMFFTDDVQSRLRAHESARRRVHHAAHGRDGLQDRHAERHLRQSHSDHAVDALVGTGTVLSASFGWRSAFHCCDKCPVSIDGFSRRAMVKWKIREEDDRSRAVHTGSGQLGADTKEPGTRRWRQVDTHSRPRTAPPAGKSLAGADRPGASARVGALRCRWEPGYGWNHGEAHLGGSAHAARYRNDRDARRRSQGA